MESSPKKQSCNEAGIALIKKWEDCKLIAYQCPKGVWTIGWGHTGPEVKEGLEWTKEQAEAAFTTDILVYELAVRQHVKIPLNENEFSALVSFCYNFGETKFRTSELLKFLNKNDKVNAVKQWRRWVHCGVDPEGNPKVLQGLEDRRKEEIGLFLRSVKENSPTKHTSSNHAGIDLIKKSEGLKPEAYKCPGGVWTMDWGHTGPELKEGLVWTEAKAEGTLKRDVQVSERAVVQHVKVPVNEDPPPALTNICHNIGPTASKSPTLVTSLNNNDMKGAADQFGAWSKPGGGAVSGLTTRRSEERPLFLTPSTESSPQEPTDYCFGTNGDYLPWSTESSPQEPTDYCFGTNGDYLPWNTESSPQEPTAYCFGGCGDYYLPDY